MLTEAVDLNTGSAQGRALLRRRRITRSNCTKMVQKGEGGTLLDRSISYPVNVSQGMQHYVLPLPAGAVGK